MWVGDNPDLFWESWPAVDGMDSISDVVDSVRVHLSAFVVYIAPVIDEVAIQQPSDYCVWNCLRHCGRGDNGSEDCPGLERGDDVSHWSVR